MAAVLPVGPDVAPATTSKAGTPLFHLADGSLPLERLLMLARAHQIDLARLSLLGLADQLAVALDHAPPETPLGQKGDWVVMTAWLLQLRSCLLLPADPAAQPQAAAHADDRPGHLANLQAMDALARWLDGRPQLGRDVFARGAPETPAARAPGSTHDVDVIEFLWASLALFDDEDAPAPRAGADRRTRADLSSVPQARARILRLLAELPEGQVLQRFLPKPIAAADGKLRRRSAWSTTFVACLELARQGSLTLAQQAAFAPIQVFPAVVETAAALA